MDGSFSRWTDPVPASLPSPIASDAVSAKKLDRLLDDEFGEDDDLDLEDRGEDLADDWIVDDDGTYLADDDGYKGKAGRTEVGALPLALHEATLSDIQSTSRKPSLHLLPAARRCAIRSDTSVS